MIRVVIADDHPLVRDGVRGVVDAQADMAVVTVLEDGDAVVQRVPELPCDVLVLDLSLPGVPGLSALETVRREAPHVEVVVFTMYPEELVARGARAAGAHSLVSKRSPPSVLVEAIRDAARGGPRGAPDEPARWPHEDLTPRQQELFLLVCEGLAPGDLVRRHDVSPSTVSSHLAAIRRKLGVESNGEILLYAVNAGLIKR